MSTTTTEDAIKAFEKAYQVDSTHLPTLLGVAGAHYAASDWSKAFKFYQMLLVHHRDALAPDEAVTARLVDHYGHPELICSCEACALRRHMLRLLLVLPRTCHRLSCTTRIRANGTALGSTGYDCARGMCDRGMLPPHLHQTTIRRA